MTPENFNEHIIFQKINSLEDVIFNDELEGELEPEKLLFFQSAYNFISQRIKLIIPSLIQKSEMDGLSNELNAAFSNLNQFISSNSTNSLNNAINNLNNAVSKSRNLPLMIVEQDFNFSKEAANFQKTVSNKYKLLDTEKDALDNKINELSESLSNQKAELKRLSDIIEDKEVEIKNLNSTFQTNFENIESKHEQQFTNALGGYRNEIDKSKEQFRNEIDEIKNNLEMSATGIVSELEAKHDEATKLVNLIGNVGITGNYQNIANNHKKDADFWRKATIFFMVIFSFLLIWTIVDLNADNFDWVRSLLRIIAAAALSYPATYAARESTRHRKLETINRNAELELASINPFIESLDNDKQQEVKEKLVEKYFGNNSGDVFEEKQDSEKLSVKDVNKLLETILNSMKNK